MIGSHFQGVNLQFIPFSDPVEDLSQTLSYRALQDELAVFRDPHEVVLEVIDGVFGTFDGTHPVYSNGRIRLRRISAFLPPASWGVSSGGSL
jgi:hypothetical protein